MSLKDIRPALRHYLANNNGVKAIVVVSGKTHIYPVKMPQGVTATSIIYNEISGQGDHHMQGPSGLVTVRMQIACWAKDTSGVPGQDGAHALFLAVKEALDGFQGLMGTGTPQVIVQGAFIDSWRDLYDPTADMHGKIADYFINYEE